MIKYNHIRFKELISEKYRGYIRPKQAKSEGISTYYLNKMIEAGIIEKIGWGLYVLKDYPFSEIESLIEACKKVPKGVICLISALSFYELTDIIPHEVHMAIEKKSWLPKIDYPPIKFYWYSKKIFETGISKVEKQGTTISIYNIEKSIADSFKYRNKIGENIAIEALKNYIKKRDRDISALMRYSKLLRVEKTVNQVIKGIL